MSLNKSSARRLSLLTGSSLVAAGFSAAASLGVVLAPGVAVAQVCTPATVAGSGPAADPVNCTAGTYPAGITYTSEGDLIVTMVPNGATVNSTLTANGVNLTGVGADDVSFDSTIGTLAGGTGTAGPVIDVLTASGDITVRTAAVTSNAATTTHGVRAESTSGSIGITALGNVNAVNTTSGDTGIRAVTGGAGDVTITTGSPTTSTAATVTGRLRGIYAQTQGSGDVTLNLHRGVTSNATATSVAVEAVTGGTGMMTINLVGQNSLTNFSNNSQTGRVPVVLTGGSAGSGLLTRPTGDAEINVGVAAQVTNLRAITPTGTTTTLNIANYINLDDFRATREANNKGSVTNIRGEGGGAFIANVDGRLYGLADFSAMTSTGSVEINILSDGAWRTNGAPIVLSPGDDLLTTAPGELFTGNPDTVSVTNLGGIIMTGRQTPTSSPGGVPVYTPDETHIIDFGDGDDVFENGGWLIVNPSPRGPSDVRPYVQFEAETRLTGLERFVNSGMVLLGGHSDGSGSGGINVGVDPRFLETDKWYDDVLSMPGTTIVGAGGHIVYDIDINRTQANCTDRNAEGDLGAADCLILAGGAVEGPVQLYLRETLAGEKGGINSEGIVLVEMPGGTSQQGDFVVGPMTPGYSPLFGGVLDKGAFMYVIVWDPDREQHILYGTLSQGATQFPLMMQSAQSLWRTSTGTWLDRQADLRLDLDEGVGGGVWLRVSGETAEREVSSSLSAGDQTLSVDNTHEQKSYTVTGGFDILSGVGGDTAYVVGLTAGYAHSELEYDTSVNTAQLDGWTGGVYGSFISGGLYVDAIVNANKLEYEGDIPSFLLQPAGTLIATDLLSVGGQIEAGWRVPLLMEGVVLEPLAGVSYVRTKFDDLTVRADDPLRPPIVMQFDDSVSLRGGVGLRVGMDQDYGPVRAQYSVLGRVWNEFEGETQLTIANPAGDATVIDEFTGSFTEVGVGASVYSAGGAVSGFVNLGGKFGDDYEAKTGSLGVRVNW